MSLRTEDFSFVGRKDELGQLQAALTQRLHVVISGAAGIGKSALLYQVNRRHPLLICSKTSRISYACEELAQQLGLRFQSYNLETRILELVARLRQIGKPVAFDNVEELSSSTLDLMESLLDRVPIWIVTQSGPEQGLAEITRHLFEFAHLQVSPLKRNDVRALIAQAFVRRTVPSATVKRLQGFYRLCNGNLWLLEKFLCEVSAGELDLEQAFERSVYALKMKSSGFNHRK
jgi:predicted ATPase